MTGFGIKITIGGETEFVNLPEIRVNFKNSLEMYYPQLKGRDYFMELVSLPQKDS